jgi:peptidoglycan/xylan/chitin deacetylase (PgdA/CDA1 family)
MYHRLAALEPFERQCVYLRRHCHLLSMDEVQTRMTSGEPFPRGAMAVTVDDGYRDFADAWPVFSRHGIPVTVYLTTSFVDRQCWLWPDEVAELVNRSSLSQADVPILGAVLRLSLKTSEQRAVAQSELIETLKNVPDKDRRRVIAELPDLLGSSLSADIPEHCRPLSWDQVRRLAAEGASFGAHTRTHPILSRLQDFDVLDFEIRGSRERIEEMLQASVRHFCYPNGRPQDIGAQVEAAVRKAGYRSAVTTTRGLNGRKTDPFQLRRFACDPGLPWQYFRRVVAGLVR